MSSTVKAAHWRFVEVGRIVLVNNKDLGTIVEIIDQKRALIDGPKVQRQAISLNKVVLTPHKISLPRGSRTATVLKKFESSDVASKWEASSWAKKLATKERRRELSDFDRFKVMVLKKQRRYNLKKAVKSA
ncbi:unnamed protein product [Candida verbasci]|uniref:Large ribosomal subunit protein eL14 domain-containing protein n=1 Tax=Candida verbasci TaxID=1227364 RepID=A0A9W4TRU7_9ASCO|nr:unnamed protein product [Candida verbasci]